MIDWLLGLVSGKAIKAGAETADAITAIPKNLIEAEKARLEVENLKYEKSEQDRLVVPATYQQTLEHSNVYRRVSQRIRKLNEREPDDPDPIERLIWVLVFVVFVWALFAFH
ncbi:MAG: hypothetical protein WAM66_09990 [Acidobacteriaceae bacterium]